MTGPEGIGGQKSYDSAFLDNGLNLACDPHHVATHLSRTRMQTRSPLSLPSLFPLTFEESISQPRSERRRRRRRRRSGKTELALILPHLNTDRQSREREREREREKRRRMRRSMWRWRRRREEKDKSEKGSGERLQGAQKGTLGEKRGMNVVVFCGWHGNDNDTPRETTRKRRRNNNHNA